MNFEGNRECEDRADKNCNSAAVGIFCIRRTLTKIDSVGSAAGRAPDRALLFLKPRIGDSKTRVDARSRVGKWKKVRESWRRVIRRERGNKGE